MDLQKVDWHDDKTVDLMLSIYEDLKKNSDSENEEIFGYLQKNLINSKNSDNI